MPVHIVGKTKPDCPLCSNPFEKKTLHANGRAFYVCKRDELVIDVHDPFVDNWSNIDPETGEAVSCPVCKNQMNVFCRSDGYMKAACPRCHATIGTEEIPDSHYDTKKGEGDKILDS